MSDAGPFITIGKHGYMRDGEMRTHWGNVYEPDCDVCRVLHFDPDVPLVGRRKR